MRALPRCFAALSRAHSPQPAGHLKWPCDFLGLRSSHSGSSPYVAESNAEIVPPHRIHPRGRPARWPSSCRPPQFVYWAEQDGEVCGQRPPGGRRALRAMAGPCRYCRVRSECSRSHRTGPQAPAPTDARPCPHRSPVRGSEKAGQAGTRTSDAADLCPVALGLSADLVSSCGVARFDENARPGILSASGFCGIHGGFVITRGRRRRPRRRNRSGRRRGGLRAGWGWLRPVRGCGVRGSL